MAILSVLLLLVLTDASTALFNKQHVYSSTELTWSDAQEYCRKNYANLSVIDTQAEFDNFAAMTSQQKSQNGWIGLDKDPREDQFTQWCDGTQLDFAEWKGKEPHGSDTDNCVFTHNNQWDNTECSRSMASFCYSWTPEMIVVQEVMSWDEALVHCRTHYTDLLSVTSHNDFFLLNSRTKEIQTSTVWTGLRFLDGSWFWVNRESRLPSVPPCPVGPFRCGARNVQDDAWENRDCQEKMNFICYHDVGTDDV